MSPKKRAQRPAQRPGQRPGQRSPAQRKRAPAKPAGSGPGPQQSGAPFYTPGGSSLRRSIERASAPALVLLTQWPRAVMMFAPLALLLLGFFLPLAFGLVFLAIFLVFTSWLAYLSWPRTDSRAKLIRIAIFALVVALAAIRIARR